MKKRTFDKYLEEVCCPSELHTNNSDEGFQRWLEQLDPQEIMDYAEMYGDVRYEDGQTSPHVINIKNMNNAESIKRKWISWSESQSNKYNESLRQAVGEWTGEMPADSRGGEDTGSEQELKDNNN